MLSDISPETLLSYIARVVNEQGQQTQKPISEAFSKFESTVETKIEDLASCQTEAEMRISGLEDEVILLKSKVEKLHTERKAKIIDLEGRSRYDKREFVLIFFH